MYIEDMWRVCQCFFFFNDTATTEIYTLPLHDALPIYPPTPVTSFMDGPYPSDRRRRRPGGRPRRPADGRSEEHTSELQSRQYLVCRLLLEKKIKPYDLSAISHYYLFYFEIRFPRTDHS